MSYLPTGPLVAVAWLRTLSTLTAGVSTRLPADASSWEADGFAVVSVVGGTGSRHVDLRTTIVSVDCWAVALNSGQAPYGKANQVAAIIRAATFDDSAFPVAVTPTPGDYLPALIRTAYLIQPEPREIPDPEGSRAHVTFDLALTWTVAT